MKEVIAIVFGAVVVVVLFTSALIYGLVRPTCLAAYENYEPQWGFFSGCRVMWNGVLTPTDMIREIE